MKIKQALLAACLTIGALASFSTQAQAQTIDWPIPAAAAVQGGTFPSPDRLLTFGPGMTREQVIANIGTQHFLDNPAKPNVWNYLLNFRTKPNPNEHITCQFQVLFKGELTAGYAWKPASCASAIQSAQAASNEQGGAGMGSRAQECVRCKAPSPAPATAPAPVVAVIPPPPPAPEPIPQPAPRKIEISGDALFKFRGGDFEHLLPGGKEELDRVVSELNGVSLTKLEVHGFTDTLGKDSINLPLSQKRANTVKAYLAANGVRAEAMTAEGHGATDPVKVCSGSREVRIPCEAPNRRVLIKAFGLAAAQ